MRNKWLYLTSPWEFLPRTEAPRVSRVQPTSPSCLYFSDGLFQCLGIVSGLTAWDRASRSVVQH
jgi:hypothetical protein